MLSQLESLLFVASKPLPVKKIAAALELKASDVEEALETMRAKYNHEESGIHLITADNGVQLASNPANDEAIAQFIKHEVNTELTKAQLESLTVVAYQGPITRPELEQIRGVNCSVIVRNLLMRGLIEEKDDHDSLMPAYVLTTAALAHLGVHSVEELPNYESLHQHVHVEARLSESTNDSSHE